MKMGRERAVLRWDVRSALLTQQLARAERQLATFEEPAGARERERVARLTQEIEQIRRELQALGPSPRAKMG
jgi:hypothetical protein